MGAHVLIEKVNQPIKEFSLWAPPVLAFSGACPVSKMNLMVSFKQALPVITRPFAKANIQTDL